MAPKTDKPTGEEAEPHVPQVSALSRTVADLFSQDPDAQVVDQQRTAGVLRGVVRSPRPDCVYHVADFTRFTPDAADAVRANLAKSGWRPICGPYYAGPLREDAEVVGVPQAEVFVMSWDLARKRERQGLDGWLKNKRFRDLQAARRSQRGMLPN